MPSSIFPSEDQEQEAFCRWLDLNGFDYFAVPNGGNRDRLEAVKLKKTGTKRGVSDLVIFMDSKIVFIEMKRSKKSLSSVSVDQRMFLNKLTKYQYALGTVCYGCSEAIGYMKGFQVEKIR